VFAFNEVAKLASARQAVIWPLERDLDLTSRYINGDVVWRRPTCATILQMIANPIYGGAYVCGKSGSVPRYDGDLEFDSRRVMNGWPYSGCTWRLPQFEWAEEIGDVFSDNTPASLH